MGKFSKPGRTVKEKDIKALINKGGSTSVESEDEKTSYDVLLRLTMEDKRMIDEIIGKRRIKIPRHTWLLEAIYEKIDKEK